MSKQHTRTHTRTHISVYIDFLLTLTPAITSLILSPINVSFSDYFPRFYESSILLSLLVRSSHLMWASPFYFFPAALAGKFISSGGTDSFAKKEPKQQLATSIITSPTSSILLYVSGLFRRCRITRKQEYSYSCCACKYLIWNIVLIRMWILIEIIPCM